MHAIDPERRQPSPFTLLRRIASLAAERQHDWRRY